MFNRLIILTLFLTYSNILILKKTENIENLSIQVKTENMSKNNFSVEGTVGEGFVFFNRFHYLKEVKIDVETENYNNLNFKKLSIIDSDGTDMTKLYKIIINNNNCNIKMKYDDLNFYKIRKNNIDKSNITINIPSK